MIKILRFKAFLLFALITLVSCSSNDIVEVGKSISKADVDFNCEQTDILIKENNVTSSFILSMGEKAKEDIVFNFSTESDTAVKGYQLEAETYTIPVGDSIVKGHIIFDKDMFSESSDSKTIKLIVKSDAVALNTTMIVFDVRKYIYGAPEIKVSVDSVNVEVFDNDVPVNIIISSTLPLKENTIFSISADGGIENTDYTLPTKSITINAGQKEGRAVITFKKSAFVDANSARVPDMPGDIQKTIGVKVKTSAKINMMNSTALMNVIGGYFVHSYCTPKVVSLASHIMRSFTFSYENANKIYYTMKPEHEVSGSYYYKDNRNAEESLGRIKVPTGISDISFKVASKPGYGSADSYAVAWVDWNNDGDFEDDNEFVVDMYYYASVDKPDDIIRGIFRTPSNIKPGYSTTMRIGVMNAYGSPLRSNAGCGKASTADIMDVRIFIFAGEKATQFTANLSSETVKINDADVTKEIKVTLESAVSAEAKINVNVSGIDKAKYILKNKVITIPTGSKTGTTTITFKKDAYQMALQNDEVTIELEAQDLYHFESGKGTKATFKVTGEGTKPMVGIEAPKLNFVVKGSDLKAKFNVVLSEVDSKDILVNINLDNSVEGMVLLPKRKVTIPAGEKSVEVEITFIADNFYFADNIISIPIMVSSTQALLNEAKKRITFRVEGLEPLPEATSIIGGNSISADVSSADAEVSIVLEARHIKTKVMIDFSLNGEYSSKAYFKENNSNTLRVEFDPADKKGDLDAVVKYIKVIVKQSEFIADGSLQHCIMNMRPYRSNLNFGGDKYKNCDISVVRRAHGTYCPIIGGGDEEFYPFRIYLAGKRSVEDFKAGYTDKTSIEISVKAGEKFKGSVEIHKNSSIPSGKYDLYVYMDVDGDFAFNDYWTELMTVTNAVDDSRTKFNCNSMYTTVRFESQDVLPDNLPAKGRIRVYVTRNDGWSSILDDGCIRPGGNYEGTTIDFTYKRAN